MRGCKFGRGWPKIGDGHYPCVLAKTVFTFDQAQARARDSQMGCYGQRADSPPARLDPGAVATRIDLIEVEIGPEHAAVEASQQSINHSAIKLPSGRCGTS